MYTGHIVNEGVIQDVDRIVKHDDKVLSLEDSLRVVNHSPTGFCWGYGGSGPSQLALAILLEYFDGDTDRALAMYQDFKFDVIAKLPIDSDFALTDEDVEKAITKIIVRQMKNA